MSWIEHLSIRLHRFSSGKTLMLSAGALAIVLILLKILDTPFGVMRIKIASGGVRILDMQGFYTPEQAYATLEALGEAGRQAYFNFLVFGDVLLPLAYGLFLGIALSVGIRGMLAGRVHWARHLSLLPFLAVVLDLLENFSILALLARYPERADGLATLAGILTMIKRGVLMVCLWGGAVALAGWGVTVIFRRIRRMPPQSDRSLPT